MPQIASKDISDFIEYLTSVGLTVRREKAVVGQLKPTQNEINYDKVEKKVADFESGFTVKPFIVSSDGHILDGHHQWRALSKIDPCREVEIYRVDCTMDPLVNFAKGYPKVFYKDIVEGKENNDQPTAVDATKEKQDREKKALADRQSREMDVAKQTEFQKKLEQDRRDREQKDREAATKSEALEYGTYKVVRVYAKAIKSKMVEATFSVEPHFEPWEGEAHGYSAADAMENFINSSAVFRGSSWKWVEKEGKEEVFKVDTRQGKTMFVSITLKH